VRLVDGTHLRDRRDYLLHPDNHDSVWDRGIPDRGLWPFGRTIVARRDAGVASVIGNVIWIVLFGLWLALGHLTTGITLCLTIIGIPLGLASFKLIPISLVPLGTRIVPTDRREPTPATGHR
jgi:uncharacterized membrane protein YccF (DUF307 family)